MDQLSRDIDHWSYDKLDQWAVDSGMRFITADRGKDAFASMVFSLLKMLTVMLGSIKVTPEEAGDMMKECLQEFREHSRKKDQRR